MLYSPLSDTVLEPYPLSERKRFTASIIEYLPGMNRRLREAALILLVVSAAWLVFALGSYHPGDPGWSTLGESAEIHNLTGRLGSWLSDLLYYLFGYMAWLFPALLVWLALRIFRAQPLTDEEDWGEVLIRVVGFVLSLGAGTALFDLHADPAGLRLPAGGGGIIGDLMGAAFVHAIGFLGATLFLLALFLAGITLFAGLSWVQIIELTGRWTLDAIDWLRESWHVWRDRKAGLQARMERETVRQQEARKVRERKPPEIKPFVAELEESKRAVEEVQQPLFEDLPASPLPPLKLLEQPPTNRPVMASEEFLEALSRQVELKLADYNVEVQVVGVYPGPVITRFEIKTAPGVKSSQISNLAKDLARGLSVLSVRVVEVIPGKDTMGLEIPNANREIVYLSEVLRSRAYEDTHSPLALALGKDIGGLPRVADLAKMPHLLVAGTTGSGKSVAINAMILSLLYKATPDEVRLILVDPKMLELSVYEGIPHLLTPVVTDMKDAANALRWCVAEMERRYRLMAALGVRNLAGYNRKVKEALDKGQGIPDPLHEPDLSIDGETAEETPVLEPMPYIVVIIDEFADMIMVVGKKVEELIARLAQKARAAGIHLILATQRPSVDVITGLIKSNIPSRIAFQVSSKVDSRTILDQMGAEQLLGHGDMLFMDRGMPVERVHGAYVSDDDVHRVTAYLKKHYEPDYDESVLNELQSFPGGQTIGASGLPEDPDGEQDALYDQAVAIVTESRRASISYLQRRLSVGYNRAARMIEEMEAAGVVSPPNEKGNREVLAPPPPEG